jgi:hypothetical protein
MPYTGAPDAQLRVLGFTGVQAFHGEKELFNSDHPDQCDLNTVLGKCRVMPLKKYQDLETVGEHDYFTRFTYKVSCTD